MSKIKTTVILIAFIATTGLVSMAFADGGWDGYGGHMGYGPGYGGSNMGPGMMGYGSGYGMGPGMMGYGRGVYPGDLSPEDGNRLQQIREKFFAETRELRREIRDKQFALNDELDGANPDRAKVTELQKALSQLQSDYDQKVLTYQLNMRKTLPQSRGPASYGYGPGYGGCNW